MRTWSSSAAASSACASRGEGSGVGAGADRGWRRGVRRGGTGATGPACACGTAMPAQHGWGVMDAPVPAGAGGAGPAARAAAPRGTTRGRLAGPGPAAAGRPRRRAALTSTLFAAMAACAGLAALWAPRADRHGTATRRRGARQAILWGGGGRQNVGCVEAGGPGRLHTPSPRPERAPACLPQMTAAAAVSRPLARAHTHTRTHHTTHTRHTVTPSLPRRPLTSARPTPARRACRRPPPAARRRPSSRRPWPWGRGGGTARRTATRR
jgi:hypothetical protein